MQDDSPVIIIGAPRSGTSLMQKLIRELPGFASVPKESDMIWLPYCHPSMNDWQYEGCPDSRITPEAIADIRAAFTSQALSATTWRLFDRLGLMDRPRLAACLRLAYRTLFRPWSRVRDNVRKHRPNPGRLVDKSVHAGLWLNLVDAVFPNARYLHMVRSPATCVPSMMHGWRIHHRFRTYKIPDSIATPRSDTSGWWCFPLPARWPDYYHRDLLEICTFQWHTINETIMNFFSAPGFSERILRVHLEDLTDRSGEVLDRISDHLNIPFNYDLEQPPLPPVNTLGGRKELETRDKARIEEHTAALHQRLIS